MRHVEVVRCIEAIQEALNLPLTRGSLKPLSQIPLLRRDIRVDDSLQIGIPRLRRMAYTQVDAHRFPIAMRAPVDGQPGGKRSPGPGLVVRGDARDGEEREVHPRGTHVFAFVVCAEDEGAGGGGNPVRGDDHVVAVGFEFAPREVDVHGVGCFFHGGDGLAVYDVNLCT